MKKTSILIADDHSLMRIGLRTLINAQSDMAVVAEADDGETAVRKALELRPDVVVMDLMMPDVNGAAATERICAEAPEVRVLILTSYNTSIDLLRAVDSGAAGVQFKGSSTDRLLGAIRSIAGGGRDIEPEIEDMMREYPAASTLTERQSEILHSVTRGLTTDDIAKQYGITPSCVKHHITLICSKLGASNRSEAAAIALRRHLLKI